MAGVVSVISAARAGDIIAAPFCRRELILSVVRSEALKYKLWLHGLVPESGWLRQLETDVS